MVDVRALKSLMVRHEALIAELSVVDRQIRSLVDAALVEAERPAPPPLPAPPVPVPAQAELAPSEPDPPTEFPRKIDYLLYKLNQNGGKLDLSECARELYGSDSLKNRNRISRTLYYMAQRSLIRYTAPTTYDILGKVN